MPKEPDISKKLTKGYAPAPDVPTHDTTDFILIIKKEVKKTCDGMNILFGVMLIFLVLFQLYLKLIYSSLGEG